jgi:L-alanine-DL-glutamate epimerase-like enolase superfamily enzyme
VTGALRIADVRVRTLAAPLDQPVRLACGTITRRTMALVEVESADGAVGLGESWVNHPPWAIAERRAAITEGIGPLLIGADAASIAALHARVLGELSGPARQSGGPGPLMQALSGVNTALWDLAGKSFGLPVAALSGGYVRTEVPVYASGLGPDSVTVMAARCAELGFTAAKVRVGFGAGTDRDNLLAAREVLGPRAALMADANQAWSLPEAVRMAGPLGEAGVAWVEEPVRGDRLADLEEFSRRTGLTVATGENIYGSAGFLPYLQSREALVLQPDVSKAGGLTETLPVCHLAAALGRQVLPHLYGGALAWAATLQLAAAGPAVAGVEFDLRPNPLRDALLTDPPAVHRGLARIPAGPGLGVTLDQAALAEFTIDQGRSSR